jgi:hypothetical protein
MHEQLCFCTARLRDDPGNLPRHSPADSLQVLKLRSALEADAGRRRGSHGGNSARRHQESQGSCCCLFASELVQICFSNSRVFFSFI